MLSYHVTDPQFVRIVAVVDQLTSPVVAEFPRRRQQLTHIHTDRPVLYTAARKKTRPLCVRILLSVTSPNTDRFSIFFCWQTQLVTLTLTLDRVKLHTVMHRSSTSTYVPNFMKSKNFFVCGRTYGRTYQWIFETRFIRSTQKSRPKN